LPSESLSAAEIRTMAISDRLKSTVMPLIREHVDTGTAIYTDGMSGYRGID
jgi:transposase-like protein